MTDTIRRRAGLALTALTVLFLTADGLTALLMPQRLAPEMAASGWPPSLAPLIGGLALVSALVHAVPRTALLGAILVTGFLGGAIATHLRLGEIGSPPQLICLGVGLVAWGGLYLRGIVVSGGSPRRRQMAA